MALKVAAVAVVGAMAALTVESVKVAGAFVEMENQFNVVFGDAAPQARAELDAFAESIGRSGNKMVGYAASIQDTFVPLGLMRDQAAELSIATVQLATDISSFKNLDMDQTVDRITSALAGQHRAVQQLGIIINQTNLAQELSNMGVMGGVQAATEAEKAQARLNIMFAASSDAIGDAERTSGEWTNQLRGLEDAWYDIQLAIGQEVIPILEELLPEVKELLEDFGEMAVRTIPAVVDAMANFLFPVLRAGLKIFIELAEGIGQVAEGWNKLANTMFTSPLLDDLDAMRSSEYTAGLVSRMEPFLGSLHEMEGRYIANRDALAGYTDEVGNFINELGILETVSGVLTGDDGVGGGGGTTEPPIVRHSRTVKENMKEASDIWFRTQEMTVQAIEAEGLKREMITEAFRVEEEQVRQINDLMTSGAADFGRALREGGEGMLQLAVKIGIEFAKIQLGKSLGGPLGLGLSFLGGLI